MAPHNKNHKKNATSQTTAAVPKSPFFKPNSQRQRRDAPPAAAAHKSSPLGCTANLMNAIIGSGIVGIPYAIKNAGLVAGICLILLCALLTDKSLRLLLATAKHARNVQSYETLAEAAFGPVGFWFIAANMFIMAYGAMLSYLMIIKDTFPFALAQMLPPAVDADIALDPENVHVKRMVLTVISLLVIVPLSSQRVRVYSIMFCSILLFVHVHIFCYSIFILLFVCSYLTFGFYSILF